MSCLIKINSSVARSLAIVSRPAAFSRSKGRKNVAGKLSFDWRVNRPPKVPLLTRLFPLPGSSDCWKRRRKLWKKNKYRFASNADSPRVNISPVWINIEKQGVSVKRFLIHHDDDNFSPSSPDNGFLGIKKNCGNYCQVTVPTQMTNKSVAKVFFAVQRNLAERFTHIRRNVEETTVINSQ